MWQFIEIRKVQNGKHIGGCGTWPVCQAPYRFRHAALTDIRDFLVSEMREGRFHPLFRDGLD